MNFLDQLKNNPTLLTRAILTLIYLMIFSMIEILVWGTALIQVGYMLLNGKTNPDLLKFGNSLTAFITQILRYTIGQSDQKPFPFNDLPKV